MDVVTDAHFRWHRCFGNKKRLLLAATLFVVSILQSGCIKFAIEDKIVFRPDGSGTATLSVAVGREALEMVALAGSSERPSKGVREQAMQELTQKAAKVGGTARMREDEEMIYGDITFSFGDTGELMQKFNRLTQEYGVRIKTITFYEEEKTPFHNTYTYVAEISAPGSGEAAAFFRGWTHRVSLPGRITETNGTVKGDSAEWKVLPGVTLHATATSTTMSSIVLVPVGVLVVGGAAVGAVIIRRMVAGKGRAWRCPKCRQFVQDAWGFCQQCGQQLRWTVCSSCGQRQFQGSRYCTFCGASLSVAKENSSSQEVE